MEVKIIDIRKYPVKEFLMVTIQANEKVYPLTGMFLERQDLKWKIKGVVLVGE